MLSQTATPARGPAARAADVVTNALEVVSTAALLALTVHTVANALMRTFLNQPLEGANEYAASWYLPVVAFAGFVVAQSRHKHIEVDVVLSRFDRLRRAFGLRLAWLTGALTMALLAWGTGTEALHNFEVRLTAGVMGVPVWPFTFLAPLAFAALTLQLLVRALRPVAPAEEPHPEEAGVL
jgi:TRAP-type C4-dicarboxylate transport system permease small subunit